MKRGRQQQSSSSPAEESDSEKSICIFGESYGEKEDERMVFYRLNLSNNCDLDLEKKQKRCPNCDTKLGHKPIRDYKKIEESPTVLNPIWETDQLPGGCRSCYAVLGSTIYSMGFKIRKTRGLRNLVRIGDLSCPELGWRSCPDSINSREQSQAVALRGKIYVFGGVLKKSNLKPWAEFFDPNKQEWKGLKEPPVSFPWLHLHALAYDSEDKIAVCSGSQVGLCAFNISNSCWETVDPNFCLGPYGTKPVMVGHTMYWVGSHEIHAYDLEMKRSFSGPIKCSILEEMLRESFGRCPITMLFFHLGGDIFCIIWCDTNPNGSYCSRFVCEKLRITKQFDEETGIGKVRAKQASIKAYPIDHSMVDEFDALHIQI